MKYRTISIFIICAVLLAIIPFAAGAQTNGIVLKPANSEKTSWAYYPYNPAHPFTGGKWSPLYGGTATKWMIPGTDIYRKLMVMNGQNSSALITFHVTGLPSAFTVKISPAISLAANKTGYGSIIIDVPGNTTDGAYGYTITAKAGNETSSITDEIIVK